MPTWLGKVIAFSEAPVGIAVCCGALLNFSHPLAGTGSTKPMLALVVLLALAWKVAGYIGADHALLPLLGTPWQPGRLGPLPGRRAGRVLLKALVMLALFPGVGVVALLASNRWRGD